MILAASLALIVAGFVYLGLFKTIKVEEKAAGPFTLVYLEHKGSYSEFGDKLKEIQRLVRPLGIEEYVLFGLYYDNPKFVDDESMLRSEMGVVIDPKDLGKLKELIDSKQVLMRELPKREYVSATFPYVNFISIFMGIMKVYPVFEEYAHRHAFTKYEYKETGYKNQYVLEIYGRETIYYYMTKVKE